MKKLSIFLISLMTLAILSSCSNMATSAKIENKADSASYALGMYFANMIKQNQLEDAGLNEKIIAQGIQDIIDGNDTVVFNNMQEVSMFLQKFTTEHMAASQASKMDENGMNGKAFLAENAKKEGVVVLESGLQYKIITEGTGPKPTINDTATCHYKGTHANGEVFQSSYDAGQPITFPVTGVIQGWTEALQLMNEGTKCILYIPGDLAYGPQGSPRAGIGPNETLIFEMELLEVIPAIK